MSIPLFEIKAKVKKANRSELHRLTGLSLSGVSRILSGDRAPSADSLKKLADHLGLEMGDLHFYLSRKRKARKRGGKEAA